jgi:hypothetical protein
MSEFASIRDAMELRFPYADFRSYFEFIDTCAGGGKHRHHVAPRCEFSELIEDLDNIALLSYEDHARAHVLLSEAVPDHLGFRVAALHMFGKSEEAFLELCKKGAREGGRKSMTALRKRLGKKGLQAVSAMGIAAARAGGWRGCRKGHATQAAAGHPQLAKAHAVVGGIEGMKAWGRKIGAIAAKKYPEMLRRNLDKGRHTTNHTRRGIVNTACKFCQGVEV